MLTAVTGINWGDEGKGRVIDLLAENADVVARYQGGNNAGHTVVTEKGKFILNLLPSGILHPDVTCVLGTGMVIDLDHLANEMQAIEARGVEISPKNLKLSDKATISMPWHKVQDGLEFSFGDYGEFAVKGVELDSVEISAEVTENGQTTTEQHKFYRYSKSTAEGTTNP